MDESENPFLDNDRPPGLGQAESLLKELADRSSPVLKAAKRPSAEARYQALVEQIPAVIFMAFLDEGVSEAYVSPHIEKVLGFTQDEWLRDPVRWYRQIHPDDRGRWNVEAAQLVLSGQPLRSVYRVIARDGRVVWFHCQVKIVRSEDGRPWFIHGTGFDITDLKQAEQALKEAHDELDARVQQRTAELARSNADLQQFAYSASHDLQEPLRNIAIYSQLLGKRYQGKLDAKADEFIKLVSEGAQRMSMMLRDLLAYTQAASSGEHEEELVDSNVVLAKSLEDLQVLIRDSHATVTQDPLPSVRIHRVHLQQLFQNLISNAIKYRGDEPPRIHVSAASSNDECVFSVKDNGIGIAPEYHDQIFGIFKRLHGRDRYTGTGIGLAICKRIVERYGGRIWVESEPNRGAAFLFALPLCSRD